ncbi:NAD-dependent epimerase [Actinomadura roseirufa]|uniref:NAD-dependent epimerase n=1 Tax=Actinomadura roseirufa TaxID=2094049 RepID=UPI001041A3EB|nr:NAD-dependent epimerase [Actinomadura roseirufa]
MTFHVVVGRGGTAVATARLFAEAGDRVLVVSRTGGGPDHPLVERIALDAHDTAGLSRLSEGAETVVNAVMTPYHTWPETAPPLFGSILAAAERSGGNYVMLGNLYAYGPRDGSSDGPITEDHPLAATGPKGRVRAELWLEAKEAHDAGRVRATEVRGGQFIGAGAYSLFSLLVQPNVLAGRLSVVPASPDTPHPYSAIGDVARAIVAVSHGDRAWGRPWHAPVINASLREVAERLAALADAPVPRLEEMTERELTLLSLGDPFWGELWETEHMSHHPYPVDSSELEAVFGVSPSRLDDVLKEIVV